VDRSNAVKPRQTGRKIIAQKREFIYLEDFYCIINELGRNDDEGSRIKNAIETLNLRHTEKSDIPSGCISLKDYISILAAASYGHVRLIRLIAQYQSRCDSEGKYLLARDFLNHNQILRNL
jgi:hypothetical protein